MALTDDQKQLIKTLSEGGFIIAEISRLTQLPYSLIRRYMRRAGIERTHYSSSNKKRDLDIARLYLEGKSMTEIGITLAVSRERVRQILKKQSIAGKNQKARKVKPPKFKPTNADRFWAKVDKKPGHGPSGDCWIWTGCRNGPGYRHGRSRFFGVDRSPRAVSLYLRDKKWHDPKLKIGTTCGVTLCVNPDHLFIGTMMDLFISKSPVYQRNKAIAEQRNGKQVGSVPEPEKSPVPDEIPIPFCGLGVV